MTRWKVWRSIWLGYWGAMTSDISGPSPMFFPSHEQALAYALSNGKLTDGGMDVWMLLWKQRIADEKRRDE